MTKIKTCEICGTTDGVIYKSTKYNKVLCSRHSAQMDNHGKILERTRYDGNKFIINGDILTITMYDNKGNENGETILDAKHYDAVSAFKWHCLKGSKYAGSRINGKQIQLHRLITNANDEMVVDHRNHNTLDNRDINLKVCTRQENSWNYSNNPANTSGHKGVY